MVGKFIQQAIKRPGALRRKLKAKAGQPIPLAALRSKINALHVKAQKGKLGPADSRTLKQMNLAMTLRKMH